MKNLAPKLTLGSRAYALVTVLSMILIASLIGSFFLKKSSNLSELSSIQARQSALKNQSSAIFNEVARSFTFYLEQRRLDENSEPADLLDYACSESGTTPSAGATTPPCFNVRPFKSRGISISIFCRGQGSGESYVSNICSTERIFPKDFFAEIQIRNPEEKNELLTASGEMRVEPEPLNAYAFGLSNIDASIQFGAGSYLGNIALNFTSEDATATFKPKDGEKISISEAIITNDISKLVFQGDVTYPGAKQLPDLANFNQAFVEGFEQAAATSDDHILISSSSSEIELPNLPNNWIFNGDGNLVDEAGDPITNLPCKDGDGDVVSGGCAVLGVWQAPEDCSFSPWLMPITLREPWELRLKANDETSGCETSHIRRQKRWREYHNYLILKLTIAQYSEYFGSSSHIFYLDGWEQVNSFVYYGHSNSSSTCEDVPEGQTWVRIHLRKTETTEVGPVNLSDKTLLDFDDPAGVTLLSQEGETMASSCRDKTLAVRTQGPMILMNSFQNIGDAAALGTAFFAKNFILPSGATWICDVANPEASCGNPKDFLFEASLIATDPEERTIDLGSIHSDPNSPLDPPLELGTLRVVGGRVGGEAANIRLVNSDDNLISGFENVEYIFQPNQSPALIERVFVGNLTVSVLSFHIHSSDPKEALAEVGLEWTEPEEGQIKDLGVIETRDWGMDTLLDDLPGETPY